MLVFYIFLKWERDIENRSSNNIFIKGNVLMSFDVSYVVSALRGVYKLYSCG